jgi:cysteinyl-tRNA synthetase
MEPKIRIYNTMSRTTEDFKTIEPGRVRMYVCGVTPYDSAHIGHGMSVITFDIIRRYLEHRGYEVEHVQNFTDIDDKIILRANREGVDATEITERYISDWHRENAALNVLPAHVYPRATTEILEIVEMISGLIDNGHAYVAEGDVYFRVRSFEEYGKLSKRNLEDLMAGARIEVDERKEDPLDFALWKAAKPGEPTWPSPWSDGRPGWHIECSAMCSHHLRGQVDIHGGGADLIFPHHENEIAQSEAYLCVQPFALYWVHNGLLQLGGDKMSKSIGNIVRLHEIIERGLAPAFRLMVLQSHYRAPLTYTEESLTAAARGLERLQHAASPVDAPDHSGDSSEATKLTSVVEEADRAFHEAMDDDFDTSRAIASLFELGRAINRATAAGQSSPAVIEAKAKLNELAGVLGLDLSQRASTIEEATPYIDLLVQVRDRLRASKQWELSDLIRDELSEKGIVIADSSTGSTWRKT